MSMLTRFARPSRITAAICVAVALAAIGTTAQSPPPYGVFDEGFEGEIWELRGTVDLPAIEPKVCDQAVDANGNPIIGPDGQPEQVCNFPSNFASGVAWIDGELYEVDFYSGATNKFNSQLQLVTTPFNDWSGAAGSPTAGWAPNEILGFDVQLNGSVDADGQPVLQKAVLVTDGYAGSRLFAFTTEGQHLFTVRLPNAPGDPAGLYPALNGAALRPGSYFSLDSRGSAPVLSLSGELAAAWPSYRGEYEGGALIYNGTTATFTFEPTAGLFDANQPARIVGGGVDGTFDATIWGVAYDDAGNFYTSDPKLALLHGYDSEYKPLFTTSSGDFDQLSGMSYWPNASGGRLLISLPDQNKAVAYRPTPTGAPTSSEYLFKLDGLGAVKGKPHNAVFDPVSGRIAVSDSGNNDIKVFQMPSLAIFGLNVKNAAGAALNNQPLCKGANYSVEFSITVPPDRSPVQLVTQQLQLAGELQPTMAASPLGAYGVQDVGDVQNAAVNPPVQPGQVIAYRYQLQAPNAEGEFDIEASALGSTTSVGAGGRYAPVTDVLKKRALVAVTDCSSGNQPPAIEARVPRPPTASGWTPMEGPFVVTLRATDPNGTVRSIGYKMTGANPTQSANPADGGWIYVSASGNSVDLPVTLMNPATTDIEFRAQDNNYVWSADGLLTLKLDNSVPRVSFCVPKNTAQVKPVSGGIEYWWNTNVSFPVIPTDLHDAPPVEPGLVAPLPRQLAADRASLVFNMEGQGQFATLYLEDHVGFLNSVPTNTAGGVCGNEEGGANVNIDKTRPTVTADPAATEIDASPIVVTVSGADPAPVEVADGSSRVPSGVRYVEYQFVPTSGPAGQVTRVEATSTLISIAESGELFFRAIDWAGNASEQSSRVYRKMNRNPVAEDDSYSVVEDTLLTIATPGVSGNDHDPEGSALNVILVSTVQQGSLTLNADGSFTYRPGANYFGPDSFTYKVNDGQADSNVATVSITVTAVNDPPVASDDSAGTVKNQPVTVAVLGNDTDPDGNPLTAALATPPSHGTVTLTANGSFSYLPAADYSGPDSFTYTASDGRGGSATATVTITVVAVNDPPTAANDAATTAEDTPVTIPVLGNDRDPDGDTLTVTVVTQPAAVTGRATLNADGTVTYTPALNYSGPATFTYTISDGKGSTATATVTVTVTAVNDAPVCSAALGGEIWPPNHKRFYVAGVNGLTDPEGDQITMAINGILQDEVLDSTGDGQFTPDGRFSGSVAWIRAERNGHGNKIAGDGRVYEILFTATDSKGASCTGSVLWGVPHDQGGRPQAYDSVVRYDSTGRVAGTVDKTQIHQKSPTP